MILLLSICDVHRDILETLFFNKLEDLDYYMVT